MSQEMSKWSNEADSAIDKQFTSIYFTLFVFHFAKEEHLSGHKVNAVATRFKNWMVFI